MKKPWSRQPGRGEIFGGPTLATAILDRLLRHAINIKGKVIKGKVIKGKVIKGKVIKGKVIKGKVPG